MAHAVLAGEARPHLERRQLPPEVEHVEKAPDAPRSKRQKRQVHCPLFVRERGEKPGKTGQQALLLVLALLALTCLVESGFLAVFLLEIRCSIQAELRARVM
jgi:hypothetical protein